jgi:histidine triad (HIT) family protein
MTDSIFTKIIKGEIPAEKVYEDEKTYAILDIHPAQPGHTLVITKVQVDKFTDLSDEDYIALWQAVKKVSKRLLEVTGKQRIHISIVGTDVPHVHVHIVPFNSDNKDFTQDTEAKPDHAGLAEMAKKLAF